MVDGVVLPADFPHLGDLLFVVLGSVFFASSYGSLGEKLFQTLYALAWTAGKFGF